MSVRRRLVTWFALALLVGSHSVAAEKTLSEYETKALFIVNLLKYTEWPADRFVAPDAPYIIGVLGRNPFGKAFRLFEGRKVNNRPLQIKEYDSPQEAKADAHVLFVASNERSRFAESLSALENAPILTVSDGDGFVDKGGILGMSLENKRISFVISQAAANRARLGISSEVFKLAREVKK